MSTLVQRDKKRKAITRVKDNWSFYTILEMFDSTKSIAQRCGWYLPALCMYIPSRNAWSIKHIVAETTSKFWLHPFRVTLDGEQNNFDLIISPGVLYHNKRKRVPHFLLTLHGSIRCPCMIIVAGLKSMLHRCFSSHYSNITTLKIHFARFCYIKSGHVKILNMPR